MHIFHKWTKWEEYDQTMIVIVAKCRVGNSLEKWQKRTCVKCGFTERKPVNG